MSQNAELIWRESLLDPDTRIAMRWWKNALGVSIPPRGFVFVVHGIGEHGGRYEELAQFLIQAGFDVLAVDMPGHGLSKRDGNAKNLVTIIEMKRELEDSWKHFVLSGPLSKKGAAHAPWFLAGHSLGALVSLYWILAGRSSGDVLPFARRAWLSAPPLQLRLPVPAWKKTLAEKIAPWLPNLKLKNEIDPTDLSYDGGNIAAYRSDPLVHPYATPRFYVSFVAAIEKIKSSPQDIEIPLSLSVGKDDPIVDPEYLKNFYSRMGTLKTFTEYPMAKHEILNDNCKRLCFEHMVSWFLAKDGDAE